jgi:anti-sigma B factor antagonist
MASFEMDTEERSGELVVRLSGDLDLAALDAVDTALAQAQAGHSSVQVDLRGLEFIDSTGIRLLLIAHKRAKKKGDQFCVIRGSERIQRLLALTDLDQKLRFCEDETWLSDVDFPARSSRRS